MSEHGGDRRDPDATSDPARSDEIGADWADEGGATPQGPATAESAVDDGDAGGDRRAGGSEMGEDVSVSQTAEHIPSTPVNFDPPS